MRICKIHSKETWWTWKLFFWTKMFNLNNNLKCFWILQINKAQKVNPKISIWSFCSFKLRNKELRALIRFGSSLLEMHIWDLTSLKIHIYQLFRKIRFLLIKVRVNFIRILQFKKRIKILMELTLKILKLLIKNIILSKNSILL